MTLSSVVVLVQICQCFRIVDAVNRQFSSEVHSRSRSHWLTSSASFSARYCMGIIPRKNMIDMATTPFAARVYGKSVSRWSR